jgi:hypothetical protein
MKLPFLRRQLAGFFILLSFLNVSASVLYVDLNSASPIPPYTNWVTAATNIQDAVDASTNGDLILVTNGVYATGRYSSVRVLVTTAVVVKSVNGPGATVIQGSQASSNAVQCVYLAPFSAVLSGFTLTNGAADMGGGVAGNGSVINCVLAGNLAQETLPASGVGGGGAAYDVNLVNCVVTNNSANFAGGALDCKATNCLFANNSSANYGGGSARSTLVNCTLVGNSAHRGFLGEGGGGSYKDFFVLNCIVYNNTATIGSNYLLSSMINCCTAPLASGPGNVANAPLFVNPAAGDFHLQFNSPCINGGNNAFVSVATDLDGNSRIKGGTVDIGAYEYQNPSSVISYAWLQQYGLSTDGAADFIDSDNDSMNNWQEWIAGTDPTNPLSVLKMLNPSNRVSGVSVNWQSVSNRTYYLQSSTNLSAQPAFSTIQSNIQGRTGTTTITNTSATNSGPYFYRVGVQQ